MHDDCEYCKNPELRNDTSLDREWDLLKKQGFVVQPVLGEGCNPGFAYTAGLTLFDHPELIVYGLTPQTQVGMLNRFASRVVEGETFTAGQRVPLPTAIRYQVAFLACTQAAASRHILLANRMLSVDARLPVLQVVWPDKANRLPWETGYDSEKCRQPLLGPSPRLPLLRPT